MSVPLYSSMAPPPRRNPLSAPTNHRAINQPYAPPGTPPKPHVQVQEKQRNPSSPPLPRQNAKVTPPSPPRLITDKSRTIQFVRVGMLGEGGFARVYEVQDSRGGRVACKVVTKSSLKTKKAKTKLYAEIKIHRSLDHPNIVNFQECFEDDDNVYMTLELCHNGSLMDMLRRRRRFTEPESRFFMVQLIGACQYMHTHQVIHRDLKLGNIFLDRNMNVKVGDFGLAALIENPGERKKTICGTPNYIAPEVLFDTANGHSFEVDTWSIGVILYTLVVGRPPFQTKDVKAIYKRIRDNEYDFPEDRAVSPQVRELVQLILTPDPQQRPTLHEIVDHAWFTSGIVPGYIPATAHDGIPSFSHITRSVSEANLARLKRTALLDEDQVTSINVPAPPPPAAATSSKSKGMSSSLAQQEKEFQKAVQPGSPISALLSSARQPLLVAPLAAPRGEPLIRKLQAAKDLRSPVRPGRANLQNIAEHEEDEDAQREQIRKKELESQKARIVAQMVPGSAPPSACGQEDQENMPPPEYKSTRERRGENNKERVKEKQIAKDEPALAAPSSSSNALALRPNGFDAAAQTLTAAFEAKAAGRVFKDTREEPGLPDPKVFIVSWVDYCNKYGMGYALTDGSLGVHFNDSTTMILSADKHHFDYISSRRQGSVYVRKNYTVSEYPEDLKSKVYLLKHFERYIMERLYGDYPYTYEDTNRTKGMDFVQKYLRMKHVIVFKLSHDVLQFNFYDHSKVILSSQGLLITHIDKDYNLTRWKLSEIMAIALRPPVADPVQLKFNQRLYDKVKYCKEVLMSIKAASSGSGSASGQDQPQQVQGQGEDPEGFAMPGGPPPMSTRSSKQSLR
ncbi:kinase-like domain-containing protein [Rhodofomes roseus]|uniref:Serine/threonine-protein kinase n=1 Tax=Rhodofomes roseus TaxID=34475 RepID=A0ABQ8KE88_9APHY|nr:kinase-like domain-containing protein [Rhodofomes roseus]KAH9836053.1 kinase-like domain-containing protein [Rhodofomes roseus]